MISIAEHFLSESEWLRKNCPYPRQDSCIYVGHSYLWSTVGIILLICLYLWVGIIVQRVEKWSPLVLSALDEEEFEDTKHNP